jgi:hypothetical protein
MSETSDKVLAIASIYFGPAAKTFLERQTLKHMNGISFDNISKANLPELSRWVGISASLILDKAKAEEFSALIGKL